MTKLQKRKAVRDTYSVGEIVDILSTLPRDYDFLCGGEENYAILIDKSTKVVSIDNINVANVLIDDFGIAKVSIKHK